MVTWSLTKELKPSNGKKIAFSANGAGSSGVQHAEECKSIHSYLHLLSSVFLKASLHPIQTAVCLYRNIILFRFSKSPEEHAINSRESPSSKRVSCGRQKVQSWSDLTPMVCDWCGEDFSKWSLLLGFFISFEILRTLLMMLLFELWCLLLRFRVRVYILWNLLLYFSIWIFTFFLSPVNYYVSAFLSFHQFLHSLLNHPLQ